MPVSLGWIDQRKTIIYIVAVTQGRLSPEEVLASADNLREMGASVAHPIAAIIKSDTPAYFSPQYGESLRDVHQAGFPNLKLVIFVGDSLLWEIFQAFVRQHEGIPYHLAMHPTFEGAVDLARRFLDDSHLPPARWN